MPHSTPTPETTAPTVHLIALAAIDEGALARDRTGLDPEPLAELEASIAASGLRQPIELFPLTWPSGGRTHGLLSGYRRFCATRNLFERTADPRFATIRAFINPRLDEPKALAAIVEENEIRADLSPYERGQVAVMARDMGAFASIEEAVDGLYPHASRAKRIRLRAIAHFAEDVGGFFRAPERLSQRQIERISRAVVSGFRDVLRTALEESSITDPDHQWQLIQPILEEAEHVARNPEPARSDGRPRRIVRPTRSLTIRRERTRDGWCLHFTGSAASGAYMDLVLDSIERMYEPG